MHLLRVTPKKIKMITGIAAYFVQLQLLVLFMEQYLMDLHILVKEEAHLAILLHIWKRV